MVIPDMDNIFIFILFFIPGFVSMKVYDLLVLTDKRDFSKSLSEAIGYSCINYGALFWLIYIIFKYNIYLEHPLLFYTFALLILFIIPILWPLLFLRLITWEPITKHFRNPIPKPWDYVFLKRESYWIIINLKDGNRVGGIYGTDSFASLYPIEEQIYLQQVWQLDSNGKFIEPITGSKGIIIMREQISSIELLK